MSDNKGWHSFVAGNVGGILGLSVAYPFDTVKVRLQTKPNYYSGMANCFLRMIKEEGILSLYRGLASPVLGYGAINAVAFGTYATTCNFMRDYKGDMELAVVEMCCAGGVAGFAQSFVRGPVERVKTVMQTTKNPDGSSYYRSTLSCIKDLLKTQGLSGGLFRGLSATIAREVPQYGMYYPLYEFAKHLLTPDGQSSKDLSPLRLALAGATAGTLQWLPPTYCVDVVKSRMQAVGPGVYKSMWECAVRSYREEGISVFFKGLTPALLRAAPLHASIFVGYEMTLKTLRISLEADPA